MSLTEPKWRVAFRYAIEAARRGNNWRELEQAYEQWCVDGFDALVQALCRGRLHEAMDILNKRYPGSVERQRAIEASLRGRLDQ